MNLVLIVFFFLPVIILWFCYFKKCFLDVHPFDLLVNWFHSFFTYCTGLHVKWSISRITPVNRNSLVAWMGNGIATKYRLSCALSICRFAGLPVCRGNAHFCAFLLEVLLGIPTRMHG